MNGFSQGSLTFCSQNYGAKKFDRIKKVVVISQISIIVIGGILSFLFLLFGKQLLGLYTTSDEVIQAGMVRCWIIFYNIFFMRNDGWHGKFHKRNRTFVNARHFIINRCVSFQNNMAFYSFSYSAISSACDYFYFISYKLDFDICGKSYFL